MKQHIVLFGRKKRHLERKEKQLLSEHEIISKLFLQLISSLILIQMATIHISGGILVGQGKK